MRNTIYYEWTLEELDENRDIVNADFADNLLAFNGHDLSNTDVGLVRGEGNENEGITDRLWAYIKDGKLPEFFNDAYGNSTSHRVPKRFHKEVADFLSL